MTGTDAGAGYVWRKASSDEWARAQPAFRSHARYLDDQDGDALVFADGSILLRTADGRSLRGTLAHRPRFDASDAGVLVVAALVALGIQHVALFAAALPRSPGKNVAIVLACGVLVQLMRLLHEMTPSTAGTEHAPRTFSLYARVLSASLAYLALVHAADRSFGWWLTAALGVTAAWSFVRVAALIAQGAPEEISARAQDRAIVATVSAIAAGLLWAVPVAAQLQACAIFVAALVAVYFDYVGSRNATSVNRFARE